MIANNMRGAAGPSVMLGLVFALVRLHLRVRAAHLDGTGVTGPLGVEFDPNSLSTAPDTDGRRLTSMIITVDLDNGESWELRQGESMEVVLPYASFGFASPNVPSVTIEREGGSSWSPRTDKVVYTHAQRTLTIHGPSRYSEVPSMTQPATHATITIPSLVLPSNCVSWGSFDVTVGGDHDPPLLYRGMTTVDPPITGCHAPPCNKSALPPLSFLTDEDTPMQFNTKMAFDTVGCPGILSNEEVKLTPRLWADHGMVTDVSTVTTREGTQTHIGELIYTPPPRFWGRDRITLRVVDPKLWEGPGGAQAMEVVWEVDVQGGNSPPRVARGDKDAGTGIPLIAWDDQPLHMMLEYSDYDTPADHPGDLKVEVKVYAFAHFFPGTSNFGGSLSFLNLTDNETAMVESARLPAPAVGFEFKGVPQSILRMIVHRMVFTPGRPAMCMAPVEEELTFTVNDTHTDQPQTATYTIPISLMNSNLREGCRTLTTEWLDIWPKTAHAETDMTFTFSGYLADTQTDMMVGIAEVSTDPQQACTTWAAGGEPVEATMPGARVGFRLSNAGSYVVCYKNRDLPVEEGGKYRFWHSTQHPGEWLHSLNAQPLVVGTAMEKRKPFNGLPTCYDYLADQPSSICGCHFTAKGQTVAMDGGEGLTRALQEEHPVFAFQIYDPLSLAYNSHRVQTVNFGCCSLPTAQRTAYSHDPADPPLEAAYQEDLWGTCSESAPAP